MTRINLYPWREERDEHQRKLFIIGGAGLGIGGFVITMIFSFVLSMEINTQADINNYLDAELTKLTQELLDIKKLEQQKESLISRLSVIEQIEQDRYNTLNLINEIVTLIGPLMVINDIKRTKDTVKIKGYAESNEEIAEFLRKIEMSKYFSQAQLNQIKVDTKIDTQINTNNDISRHMFELQFIQNKNEILKELNKTQENV